MKIDSHQHFWIYDPVKDAWITDAMKVIQADFLPEDLQPVLARNKFDGCIAVQADPSEQETEFLLKLAGQYNFIKGVVGWVDFTAQDVEKRLEYFSRYKALKGFRHIVQGEPEDDFLLREDFCRGIALLKDFGFTYDILVYPKHLPYVERFVERFPEQKFVIDHIAKPFIKDKKLGDWEKGIRRLADFKNLSCKVSGMVTEADWNSWQINDFHSYLSVIFDTFGTERVMFGSDWPVCLVAATYEEVCEIVEKNTASLNDLERKKLWGLNCAEFYDL